MEDVLNEVLIDAGGLEGAREGAGEHPFEEADAEADCGVGKALHRALELSEEGQTLGGAADVAEGQGLLASKRVVLSEELVHLVGVGAAVAEVNLLLLGHIEHLESSHGLGGERLHPGDVVAAASKLIGDVRISEFLHDFELNVRLGDISVHEEALGS